MCWLYELARDSHLRGDRLRLALAAYESGWPTVLAAGGVPAQSRWYVDEVSEAAWRYGKVVGTPFGDGWGVPVGFPLPVPNPRKASEAMAWARAHEGYWVVPARMRHHGDRNAPPGSLVFWDTGLRAGHVALSLGDGMIATNDIDVPGKISIVPASLVERRWGARYLGWTAPYFPEGATW
jgi:class 3 adenylate cyclase